MSQIDQHVLKNKAEHKVDNQHRIYSKLRMRIKYWFRAEYLSLDFQSIYILRLLRNNIYGFLRILL